MDTQQAKFEGWAIVEMMGHRREVGFVTTEFYGAASLFRIDTPGLEEREIELARPEYATIDDEHRLWPAGTKVKREAVDGRSVLIGPSSVYALNPCTEEAALKAVEAGAHGRPMKLISLPERAQLPPAEVAYQSGDEDDENRDDIGF